MHAGLFSVFVIRRTLTWTTEALTCVCDFFAYVYTRGEGWWGWGNSVYSPIRGTSVGLDDVLCASADRIWRVEPNNLAGKENCGALLPRGRWGDFNCDDQNNYICRIALPGCKSRRNEALLVDRNLKALIHEQHRPCG